MTEITDTRRIAQPNLATQAVLRRKRMPITAILAWLPSVPALLLFLLFVVLPLGLFIIYSLWQLADFQIVPEWTLKNYTSVLTDPAFQAMMLNTLGIAGMTALATTVIATVLAGIARFTLARWQSFIVFSILIALFSGYLVRIFAWETLLGDSGVINQLLMSTGIVQQPVGALLYTRFTTVLVLCNFLVPMAFLPMNAAFSNVRDSEIDAARDLGASAPITYRRVVLPLVWPGIFSAFALTFIISAGDYLTPSLVGGRSGAMVGQLVADTFLNQFDWPRGVTMAVIEFTLVLFSVAAVGFVGKKVIR